MNSCFRSLNDIAAGRVPRKWERLKASSDAKFVAATPAAPGSALAVAHALPSTRDLRILAPDAAKILQGNVYGWFERIERGFGGLTSSGRVALVTWAEAAGGLNAELRVP